MNTPLPLDDARMVLAACDAVVAGARATLDECETSFRERQQAHAFIVADLADAERSLDHDETHAAAARVTAARSSLANAELLLDRASSRLTQATESLRIAERARAQAELEFEIAELHASLDPTVEFENLAAAQVEVERTRDELAIAKAAFAAACSEIFAAYDADERRVAALARRGVTVPATSALHLLAPLLAERAEAGRLRLNVRATWGKFVAPAAQAFTVIGGGALSSALAGLRPLVDAFLARDAAAVLEALESVSAAPRDEQEARVARELVELLASRDAASIRLAIDEREAPERDALERQWREEDERRAEEHRKRGAIERAEAEGRRRAWIEQQARMGNPTARRVLGLRDGAPIIDGQPLPTMREVARTVAANVFGAFVATPAEAPEAESAVDRDRFEG
jgi:hypothetical protein